MRILFFLPLFFLCQCCLSQHWQGLGGGLKSWGYTTEIFTDTVFDRLYVAGPFTRVDGDTVWGIASWNGTNWDSLGHGIDRYPNGPFPPGNTWGMVHFGNYLYIGGNFFVTGTDSSRSLSRWDGMVWDTIPGGQPNDAVDDMLVYNNELYICGVFDSVGNVSASGIAKWDGAIWQPIGNNYDFEATGSVNRMIFYHGNLYVGGFFEDPQGNVCRLAKWDGTGWQFMTNNLVGSIADVWDLEVYNNELYVSGLFYAGAGNAGNCIVRWNDTLWRDVGGSVDFYSFTVPQVRDMKVYGGKLYCAGNFEMVGGIMAMGLASWDGTNWCGYNTSFQVNSQETGLLNIEFYNDTLYASGGFFIVEGDSMNGIAKWIGGNYVDTCGNTTGIDEHFSTTAVFVFPNPSSDYLKFQFSQPQSKSILLYDSFGHLILTEQTSASQHTINVESFAEGIYFYSIIEDGELKANGKFVVQH